MITIQVAQREADEARAVVFACGNKAKRGTLMKRWYVARERLEHTQRITGLDKQQ